MGNLKNNNLHISVIGCRAYPADFPGTSGLETYTAKVIDEINNLKDRPTFMIYVKKAYQKYIDGHITIKTGVVALPTLRSRVFESLFYAFLASILVAFNESEVVWYQGVGPSIFAFIPRIFGKKVIVTVHSLDWQRKKWHPLERVIFRLAVGFSLRFCSGIYAVSGDLALQVNRDFNRKVVVAHPGIELIKNRPLKTILTRFGLRAGSYIIYLGRIVPEKRLEWLLSAYKAAGASGQKMQLVVAGGHGNMASYEEQLFNKLSPKGVVRTGYIFGEEKKALLYYARAFVLPSELEGNSISFMEALGAGTPCVISKRFVGSFGDLRRVFTFRSSFSGFKKAFVLAVKKKNITKAYTKEELHLLNKYTWTKAAKVYIHGFKS